MRKRLFCLGTVVSIILILGLLQFIHAAEFFCPAGNVTCLIAKINEANRNSETNTIFLEPGTYTLTAVNNDTDGPNGLPSIRSRLTIRQDRQNAIIERDLGAPNFRIFHVAAEGRLSLFGLLVRGGQVDRRCCSPRGGAGILNLGVLEIRRVIVAENTTLGTDSSPDGAGIYTLGPADIIDSAIADNVITGDGFGAGILAGGEVNIVRSSIHDNSTAFFGGGVFGGGINIQSSSIYRNDAIAGGGALALDGDAQITNTTIAQNSSGERFPGGAGGEAIHQFGGVLKITNSTIAENPLGNTSFGAGIVNSGGIIELQNTILALNASQFFGGFQDCSGPVISLGNNIIGTTSNCTIDLQPTDLVGNPGLGPLTMDNDGNVYFPLLSNSPAIGSANPNACPPTDQLGLPRLGNCDIGSVEFQGGRMVVSVDIRPKKDANRINPSSTKNINVAIFSGNGFDATTVDPTSARFGATGTEATPINVRVTDVDGDGLRDMVLRFQILDAGIKCGDTSAFLAGQTSGGQSFIGSSPLTTVQCKQEPQTVASRYSAQK